VSAWASSLQAVLEARDRLVLERRPGEREAAVLVPLIGGERAPGELLVLRRSHRLAHHAGQIAFPGGAVEPDDESLEAAALREAHEEVGLEPDRVRVLGRLDDLRTPSGFVITPVVGALAESFQPVPDPAEVDEVIHIPYALVVSEEGFRDVRIRRGGVLVTSRALLWQGSTVWGATARMLLSLRRLLGDAGLV